MNSLKLSLCANESYANQTSLRDLLPLLKNVGSAVGKTTPHMYYNILIIIILNLQTGKELFTSVNGTGIAMLFSAGTFLYVATVHVLPGVDSSHGDNSDQAKAHKRTDLILLVLGICSPLLLSQTHSH